MSRQERTAAGDRPPGRAERSQFGVRLTPRASRDAIEGFEREPGGRGEETLHVRVTAPPIEGRANAALVRLLARALDVPPSDVRLAAGARGRRKRVEVAGLDGAEARRRLARASAPADDRGDGG
jgi:uncharacterized protein YggU (UPF0235/DUF167 family)